MSGCFYNIEIIGNPSHWSWLDKWVKWEDHGPFSSIKEASDAILHMNGNKAILMKLTSSDDGYQTDFDVYKLEFLDNSFGFGQFCHFRFVRKEIPWFVGLNECIK